MTNLGKLLNRKDAAAYIREKYARPCTVGLLNKLAVRGDGPEFRKMAGRFVVYEQKALDAWAQAQIGAPQTSTSYAGRRSAALANPRETRAL
jgi:hypothetical protein